MAEFNQTKARGISTRQQQKQHGDTVNESGMDVGGEQIGK